MRICCVRVRPMSVTITDWAANEAPPAIISDLPGRAAGGCGGSSWWRPVKQTILIQKAVYFAPVYPHCRILIKDATDRNRTSPFAFTGNKFEFRMVGSAGFHREPQHHPECHCAESPSTLCHNGIQGGVGACDGILHFPPYGTQTYFL